MTGYLFEPQLFRREKTTVTRKYARFRVHQNRIVETERFDAGGDLRDLGFGVGPGSPRLESAS